MRKLIGIFICLLAGISAVHAEEATEAKEFTLTTTAVLDEGAIPVLYTCDGKDLQPQFSWTNAPEKTQTFVMLFSDPEAPNGTFYHWILTNLPKATSELPEGMPKPPAGAVLAKNSFGKNQYNGPCPPKGTAHTYIFTLYALDTKLSTPATADGKTILDAMKGHILGEAKLTTSYSRWVN